MKNKLYLKTWLLAGFSALSMLYSCNDEDYSAGVSLLPPSELISVHFDSSQTVEAYSYKMENYIDVSYIFSSLQLGYCNDPILGESKSDIITHVSFFTPLDDSLNIKYDVEIYSVILYMRFYLSDGDTTESQQIKIYELEKGVDLTKLDGQILYPETLDGYIQTDEVLDTLEFQPRLYWPTGETVISKELSKEFGKRLLTTRYIIDEDTINPYDNDSLFNALTLSGLYFESMASDARKSTSTVLFDSTRIEVLYKTLNKEDNNIIVQDSILNTYEINNHYKANIITHKFNDGLGINEVHEDVSTSESGEYVYLKNNNGLFTRLVIEDIGNWADSTNISINKASVKLAFIEETDADSLFLPIYSINVFQEIGNTLAYMQDHFNGTSSPVSRTEDGYEIIFTTEMQEMIKNNEKSITIMLQSASNYSGANRSVMIKPERINITYSKY